jgi:hypothetical protein
MSTICVLQILGHEMKARNRKRREGFRKSADMKAMFNNDESNPVQSHTPAVARSRQGHHTLIA